MRYEQQKQQKQTSMLTYTKRLHLVQGRGWRCGSNLQHPPARHTCTLSVRRDTAVSTGASPHGSLLYSYLVPRICTQKRCNIEQNQPLLLTDCISLATWGTRLCAMKSFKRKIRTHLDLLSIPHIHTVRGNFFFVLICSHVKTFQDFSPPDWVYAILY